MHCCRSLSEGEVTLCVTINRLGGANAHFERLSGLGLNLGGEVNSMMKSYLFQIWGGRLFLFIGVGVQGGGVLENKWLLKYGGESMLPFMCLEFGIVRGTCAFVVLGQFSCSETESHCQVE